MCIWHLVNVYFVLLKMFCTFKITQSNGYITVTMFSHCKRNYKIANYSPIWILHKPSLWEKCWYSSYYSCMESLSLFNIPPCFHSYFKNWTPNNDTHILLFLIILPATYSLTFSPLVLLALPFLFTVHLICIGVIWSFRMSSKCRLQSALPNCFPARKVSFHMPWPIISQLAASHSDSQIYNIFSI